MKAGTSAATGLDAHSAGGYLGVVMSRCRQIAMPCTISVLQPPRTRKVKLFTRTKEGSRTKFKVILLD